MKRRCGHSAHGIRHHITGNATTRIEYSIAASILGHDADGDTDYGEILLEDKQAQLELLT